MNRTHQTKAPKCPQGPLLLWLFAAIPLSAQQLPVLDWEPRSDWINAKTDASPLHHDLPGPGAVGATPTKVVSYPAPAGVELSTDYEVKVNGQSVAVYSAPTWQPDYAPPFGGPYSFASFDFAGRAEVSVTTRKPLDRLAVLPHSKGVKSRVEGHTATFGLEHPGQLSIEPQGKKGPLLLFRFGSDIEPIAVMVRDAPKDI